MADQKKDVKKPATNDPDLKRQQKIAQAKEKKMNRKAMRRGSK